MFKTSRFDKLNMDDFENSETPVNHRARLRDLNRVLPVFEYACKEAVYFFSTTCPHVDASNLTARVDLCDGDGSFSELACFNLAPFQRRYPIVFERSKGANGVAWDTRDDVCVRISTLAKNLSHTHSYDPTQKAKDAAFNALPAKSRFGMSAWEVGRLLDYGYTAFYAYPIFKDYPSDQPVLAVLSLEYQGKKGFAEIEAQRNSYGIISLASVVNRCQKALLQARGVDDFYLRMVKHGGGIV